MSLIRLILTAVIAGLVPRTPNFKGQSGNNRGGRDKPGRLEKTGAYKNFSQNLSGTVVTTH